MKEVQDRFEHIFDLHDTVFVLDATSVTSPALKHLKSYLSETKVKVTQVSPRMCDRSVAVTCVFSTNSRVVPVGSACDPVYISRASVEL